MHAEATKAAKAPPIAVPLGPVALPQGAAKHARSALQERLWQAVIVAPSDAWWHGEVPRHLGPKPAGNGGWLRVEGMPPLPDSPLLLPSLPAVCKACPEVEVGVLQVSDPFSANAEVAACSADICQKSQIQLLVISNGPCATIPPGQQNSTAWQSLRL